jgi:formate dehydrogenase subunit gamma
MRPISEQSDVAAGSSDRVLRHRLIDRLLHWTIAACMLALLATSLLPIFGIKFNWVEPHWIVGLVLTAAVVVHVLRACTTLLLRHMWIGIGEFTKSVSAQLSTVRGNYMEPVKVGKYSLAQKVFHFAMSVVVLLAIGSGIIMMIGVDTPFWERNPYFVSESMRGVVFVVHGFATLLSITMIIVHIYFAVRPEKLYFTRSMIRGWITRAEYEKNHDPDLWTADDL